MSLFPGKHKLHVSAGQDYTQPMGDIEHGRDFTLPTVVLLDVRNLTVNHSQPCNFIEQSVLLPAEREVPQLVKKVL
jgi:hypothetical protein